MKVLSQFHRKIDPSHLQYNDQWKYDSRNLNGLYNYINQLTLGANTLLGKVLEDKVYPNNSMFKAKLFLRSNILCHHHLVN